MLVWTSYFQVEDPNKESPAKKFFSKKVVKEEQTAKVLWPLKPSIPEAVIIPTFTTDKTAPYVRNYKVKYGDSFIVILKDLGLEQELANHLAYEISKTIDLNQFQVGNVYRIKYDERTKDPVAMIYDLEDRKELHVIFETSVVEIKDKIVDITV